MCIIKRIEETDWVLRLHDWAMQSCRTPWQAFLSPLLGLWCHFLTTPIFLVQLHRHNNPSRTYLFQTSLFMIKHCQRHNEPRNWVNKFATIWCLIHWLQFWPPGGATCTDCKFGHLHQLQIGPPWFALVQNLDMRGRQLHLIIIN